MLVKQLIKELKKCNQDLPVFVYNEGDIYKIHIIDNDVEDRVDINILLN